ncbi:MAG: NAD(P)H-binding protein [Bacteroidetes bacterium]|nr:NAD(P)H-binding protein [Bacteroidota bacterium]
MRVLIFGGSGNLGSRLVKRFMEMGYEVGVGIRSIEKIQDPAIKKYSVNLENESQIQKALQDFQPDVVINASYIQYAPAIVKMSEGVNSIKHFIFTGSMGVFTKLPSGSADLKREAEAILRDSKQPFTVIRPTMIYGHAKDMNISKLARSFKKFPFFPIIGSGNAKIQPINIGDLVESFASVVLKPEHFGNFYCVGCLEPITNRELFEIVRAKTGAKTRFISIPGKLIWLVIKTLAIIKIKIISEEQLKRFSEDKSLANNDFKSLTNRDPLTFEEGCEFLKTL